MFFWGTLYKVFKDTSLIFEEKGLKGTTWAKLDKGEIIIDKWGKGTKTIKRRKSRRKEGIELRKTVSFQTSI